MQFKHFVMGRLQWGTWPTQLILKSLLTHPCVNLSNIIINHPHYHSLVKARDINPLHPPLSHFRICGGRWPIYSVVCQTMRHPENRSSHKMICSVRRFGLQTIKRGDSHEDDGGLRFALRPPQAPWDSSEIRTGDVKLVLSKPFGLQTNVTPLWKGEIITNNVTG